MIQKIEKTLNIELIYKQGLCTGCGTCAGICPTGAIDMLINWKIGVYQPIINNGKCTNCRSCYKICPGHSLDFNQLNKFCFGKLPKNGILGNYLECYWGHSTDNSVRYNSSSGGLVTQLLISAIEKGIIDGALVTRMKKDRPLEPEPFIARTKEEIISASCAKYCPVPTNIMLKEILNSKEGERFAVVGIPCQMHGIRKAELSNKIIQKNIVLHIGLFCTHGISFLGTQAALKKFNVKNEEVRRINYRFGEFPQAKTSIKLDTDSLEISHLRFWNAFFPDSLNPIPSRCLLCIDQTCELADISVGSGWFPYKTANQASQSVCVIRTEFGKKLLQDIKLEDKVHLTEVNPETLILFEETERGDKKRKYKHQSFFFKLFARKQPNYSSNFLELPIQTNLKLYLIAFNTNLEIFLSSKKYLRGLLGAHNTVKRTLTSLGKKPHQLSKK